MALPTWAAIKHAALTAKGATALFGVALFFLIISAYDQFSKPYYTYDSLGNTTGHYSAGAFHALCTSYNGGVLDPLNAASSCGDAANVEAAKGHEFVLALVLAMIAAYWMRRKLKKKAAEATSEGE